MLHIFRRLIGRLGANKAILFGILFSVTILGALFIDQSGSTHQIYLSSILVFVISGLLEVRFSIAAIFITAVIGVLFQGINLAVSIQIFELVFVCFLLNRFKKSPFIMDFIFWMIFGVPSLIIISLLTKLQTGKQLIYTILVTLIAHLFSALIAEIIITYVPFVGVTHKRCRITSKISFNQILLHLSAVCVFIPLVIFTTANSISVTGRIEDTVLQQLKSTSQYIFERIDKWSSVEKRNLILRNPLQIGYVDDILNLNELTSNKKLCIELWDKDGNLITYHSYADTLSSSPDWQYSGTLYEVSPSFYKWYSQTPKNPLSINDDGNFTYIYESPIDTLTLVIKVPFSEYGGLMYDEYLSIFKILIPFCVLILIFSVLIKRIVLTSIIKLVGITYDLPGRLKANKEIILPESSIFEINSLITNFQTMSNDLNATLTDISKANEKLQVSERLLYKQAHYDILTDLPNRLYFINYASNLFNNSGGESQDMEGKQFAFIMIDLDGFKNINDNLGHVAGDKLLQEVAARMKDLENSFPASSFTARLGGDEFIIIIAFKEKSVVYQAADLISTSISRPIPIGSKSVTVHASLGISLYPEHGSTLEDMLKNSDYSMYRSKQSGGNSYHFFSEACDGYSAKQGGDLL